MPDLMDMLGSGAAKNAAKKLKGRKAQLEAAEAEAMGEKPKAAKDDTDDLRERVKKASSKKGGAMMRSNFED